MFLDPKNIGSLTNLLIFGFLGSHYGSHLELHFLTISGISNQLILNLLGVSNKDQESK